MRESTPRTTTPRSLAALAHEVLTAAEAAAGDHAPIRLRLGERQVGVRFDGPASTGAVLPAWRSLLAAGETTEAADAEVFVATNDRSGPPPLAAGAPAPRRTRTVMRDDHHELELGGARGALSLWGDEAKRGVWWTRSAEAITVADRILPLAPVLPSLLRSLGLTLARAGVVGSAKGGLLIVDASEACCSATVLAARRRGLAAIADQVVALDPAALVAHPVTGFATVTPAMLRRMPELIGRLAQLPPTEDGRQAVVLDSRPLREAGAMRLRALVITERGGARSRGTPRATG
jgi:hypothetical protein